MINEKLTAALRARAARDAESFREKFPRDSPNEKWIDNAFTAALPLAKDEAHTDFETSDDELFPIYAAEVERVLGMHGGAKTDSERDLKSDPNELLQEPTPGEN